MTWSSCFTVKCLSAVSGSGLGIIVCSKFLNSYYISGLKIVVLVCSISGFNETPSFTNLAPPTAISVSRIPPFILFSDVRVVLHFTYWMTTSKMMPPLVNSKRMYLPVGVTWLSWATVSSLCCGAMTTRHWLPYYSCKSWISMFVASLLKPFARIAAIMLYLQKSLKSCVVFSARLIQNGSFCVGLHSSGISPSSSSNRFCIVIKFATS